MIGKVQQLHEIQENLRELERIYVRKVKVGGMDH